MNKKILSLLLSPNFSYCPLIFLLLLLLPLSLLNSPNVTNPNYIPIINSEETNDEDTLVYNENNYYGIKKEEKRHVRDGSWATVRKEHLKKQPKCQWCLSTNNLIVHHIKPFHIAPDLELVDSNLITLCNNNCHLTFGHLGNYKLGYNSLIIQDSISHKKNKSFIPPELRNIITLKYNPNNNNDNDNECEKEIIYTFYLPQPIISTNTLIRTSFHINNPNPISLSFLTTSNPNPYLKLIPIYSTTSVYSNPYIKLSPNTYKTYNKKFKKTNYYVRPENLNNAPPF